MLNKNVVEYKDFGYIKVKLDSVMNERKITTYELANAADVRFQTIKNLRETKYITRIDFNVLAKICYVLDCKVEDIIEYVQE